MKVKQRNNATIISKEIRKRLIDKDITQVQLAAMLGIKKQYLNLILTGKRSGKKYKEKIEEILQMKINL